MTQRITEIVNETLLDAGLKEQLSSEEVLELIDTGNSPGGPQVKQQSYVQSSGELAET